MLTQLWSEAKTMLVFENRKVKSLAAENKISKFKSFKEINYDNALYHKY